MTYVQKLRGNDAHDGIPQGAFGAGGRAFLRLCNQVTSQ